MVSEEAEARYPFPPNGYTQAANERRRHAEQAAFDVGYKAGLEAGDYHEGFEEGFKSGVASVEILARILEADDQPAVSAPRFTDRETVAKAIWNAEGGHHTSWEESRDDIGGTTYRIADAILALHSQPLVTTRKAVEIAVAEVLTNAKNYPDPVVTHVLGRDMSPLIEKVADALLTSPAVVSRAEVEAAALEEAADETPWANAIGFDVVDWLRARASLKREGGK